MKKIMAVTLSIAMGMATFGFSALADNNDINDMLVFGNAQSEKEHNLEEYKTTSGVDSVASYQSKDDNGIYTGGGLGDGLSYRYINAPSADNKKDVGYLRFTLKADTASVNYITIRLSGNQYDRGNIMLYAGDLSTDVLNPINGSEYAEIDCGQYSSEAHFPGRYYYSTYKIPKQLVKADGTVDLRLEPTGKLDSYGTSKYKDVTQPSKYIYSVASSTNPYYELTDKYEGTGAPKKSKPQKQDKSAYEFLRGEVLDMTNRVLSWQCYGDEWDAKKTAQNAFMYGAVIRNTPIENANLEGSSDEIARRYTQAAILHQNWSTMSNLMVLSNAYCFDFSAYKDSGEILDRYFALLDFYQRAQDSEGGWCYHTSGSEKNAWLGVDLDGTGVRGTGEWWPLMSLGADAMLQSYVQLNSYIMGGSEEAKAKYNAYLDEYIDGDLTGKKDRTRREFYIDMFARLRDRLANPKRGQGDFYAPTNRAGTANQDFGFAYYANNIVEILEQGAEGKLNTLYSSDDANKYLDMVKYKYGEMADGEKWFSTANGLGLEGGASHGGWAGDYGTLLISVTERYAESSRYLPKDANEAFSEQAYNAYEAAKYYFYPVTREDGTTVLNAETYASSRKDGYGVHVSYPIAGYTATHLHSAGALSFLAKYITDERGYSGDIRNTFDTNSPHIYTNLVDSQDILKYYNEVEGEIKAGKVEPLPMDDAHPDFAWFDTDAQSVVFKNNGDKCYVTFNFRRDSWEYNDYTRVHMINDKCDRIADIRSSHQGGVYQWQDYTHLSDSGNPVTHTRFDGMSEARYGKYIISINNSKEDKTIGQTGKTYTVSDTVGVTKARDLVSGRIYQSQNGISVDVAPQSGVVLEVLDEKPTAAAGAVYKVGDRILDSQTKTVELGKTAVFEAESFDGYSLVNKSDTKKSVTAAENSDNKVVFEYEVNHLPEFNTARYEVKKADWQVFNPTGVDGYIEYEDNGNITSISSKGIDGETNLKKTFAYKEVTGDYRIHIRLTGFLNTTSDKDYFGVFMTDGLDFEHSNFVEYRHFTNNNNILMVDHTSTQEKSTTSHWAGDMNNKAVPIDVIIQRTGNVISYEFSLDGGVTYEKTSKPSFEFNGDEVMYVGVSMTAGTEILNTAYLDAVELDAQEVGEAIHIGDTVVLDFSTNDRDNDDMEFSISDLPDGAVMDNQVVTFTPVRGGEYIIRANVNDKYHSIPQRKTVKVNVEPVIKIKLDGEYLPSEVSPYITDNGRTMVPVRCIGEALGAEVRYNDSYSSAVIEKDGKTLTLKTGSNIADIDGETVATDEYTAITSSRMVAPLRFVSEFFGAAVSWDGQEQTVIINTGH